MQTFQMDQAIDDGDHLVIEDSTLDVSPGGTVNAAAEDWARAPGRT